MIQGILAIVLLLAAFAIYFWGRRPTIPHQNENPDVILGLVDAKPVIPEQPFVAEKPVATVQPVAATQPLQRIILFLRAPVGRQYAGYELLQSLMAVGLRFGEMNIFHLYELHAEKNTILFSVAAATSSGELNPAQMGDFSCSGLSLFITLNQHIYPSVNFELMLDTARQLVEDLGGRLLDLDQNLLTQERIGQLREKVKSFETNQQTMELFV